MNKQDQINLVQDYVNFLGKIYIILLSSLDDFSDTPLSTNEKVVLQVLDDKAISMKDISMRTGLALSTLTNIIDKMEEKKLVGRRHSRRDRRMVKIELAATGRRIKTKFNKLIKIISSSLMEILSDEDRRNFVAALEKTTQVMSVESSGVPGTIIDLGEPFQVTMPSQFKKK
jgi:DNA-binding MarR family transcriptional regulator